MSSSGFLTTDSRVLLSTGVHRGLAIQVMGKPIDSESRQSALNWKRKGGRALASLESKVYSVPEVDVLLCFSPSHGCCQRAMDRAWLQVLAVQPSLSIISISIHAERDYLRDFPGIWLIDARHYHANVAAPQTILPTWSQSRWNVDTVLPRPCLPRPLESKPCATLCASPDQQQQFHASSVRRCATSSDRRLALIKMSCRLQFSWQGGTRLHITSGRLRF